MPSVSNVCVYTYLFHNIHVTFSELQIQILSLSFPLCSCEDYEDQGQPGKVQGAMLQVSLHSGGH